MESALRSWQVRLHQHKDVIGIRIGIGILLVLVVTIVTFTFTWEILTSIAIVIRITSRETN